MKIFATGIDYETGEPLIAPRTLGAFAERLSEFLSEKREGLRRVAELSVRSMTFGREIRLEASRNLNDPKAAGWTFLINPAARSASALVDAIRPLAERRGMKDPGAPLLFRSEQPEDWFDWLLDNYSSLHMASKPHYILVLGSPQDIPFRFQSLLDSVASVGRLDFDTTDDLQAYVEKVIRIEKARDPLTRRQAVVFAPDGGWGDATYYSHRYMAKPLAEMIHKELSFKTDALLASDATKGALLEALSRSRPALVFTASHGMAAPNASLEIQRQVNGAICCQSNPGDRPEDWLLCADDLGGTGPLLEGSVFFQFACYGYGTPAESDYMHWLGDQRLNAEQDFVAALPKRLLAHPAGPVAFIGHVDVAWLHGFADPAAPDTLEPWASRMEPFVAAVQSLLRTVPVARAMAEMNERYCVGNALIADAIDSVQKGKLELQGGARERFVSTFITRSDAQNYMVLGDPAARVRIPA